MLLKKKTTLAEFTFLNIRISMLASLNDLDKFDPDFLLDHEIRLKLLKAIPNFRIIFFIFWLYSKVIEGKIWTELWILKKIVMEFLDAYYKSSGVSYEELLNSQIQFENEFKEYQKIVELIPKKDFKKDWFLTLCNQFANSIFPIMQVKKSLENAKKEDRVKYRTYEVIKKIAKPMAETYDMLFKKVKIVDAYPRK